GTLRARTVDGRDLNAHVVDDRFPLQATRRILKRHIRGSHPLSFLFSCREQALARSGAWSEVGENPLVYGNGREFHSREEDLQLRCTSFETSPRRGRTGPCCGIYYIVMRPIPQSAWPAIPCTATAIPGRAWQQPLRDRYERHLPVRARRRRCNPVR